MRLVPSFNNGLLSNELVLSVRDGPGRAEILPPVSRRCCDSKELEINLGYNNFFCGPRPTTRINQISSFRASALAPRFFLLSHSRPRCTCICRDATHTLRMPMRSSFILSSQYFSSAITLCVFDDLRVECVFEIFSLWKVTRENIFKDYLCPLFI